MSGSASSTRPVRPWWYVKSEDARTPPRCNYNGKASAMYASSMAA